MADISKIKLANGTTVDIKDAAGRTLITAADNRIAAEETRAKAAEGKLSTAIGAEETRATGAESGLSDRITALESKGRYLSTWDATTGLPETYPEVAGDYPKTYAYRSGDYYIVNKVAASGSTNYMPDGASITKQDASSSWVVGKTTYTGTLNLGDQFQYDGTKWTHIASATTVAFANIQGDADENTNLKGKLDALRNRTVAGVGFTDGNVPTAALQTALGLEDLAYSDTASGSVTYTPAGTLAALDVTPAGSVSVTSITQTATTYTIPDSQKADYTPAGSLLVDAAAQGAGNKVLKGGSITVTVKDADAATAVSDITYEAYTPAGTISAKATGGTSKVLTEAAFAKSTQSTTGSVQISGTVSAPVITVDDSSKDTFVKSLKAGTTDAASFTEGAFTAASYDAGFLSAGAQASFTQGAKAALTDQSKSKFAAKMPKATVGTGTDAETLIFEYVDSSDSGLAANFADAVTDRGTFTANGDDSFTANTLQTLDATKFHGGSKAADVFSAQKLPVVDGTASAVTGVSATSAAPTFTGDWFINNKTDDTVLKDVEFAGTSANIKMNGAKYLKQEINTATFSGTEAALTFSGTTSSKLVPTAVTYDKATAAAASFSGTTKSVTPVFTGTQATINVTVSPDTV